MRRVQETLRETCHSNSGKKTSANTGVKNSHVIIRDKLIGSARELKKHWNVKVAVIPIEIGALGYNYQRIGTGIGGRRKKRTSGDHPKYSIVEISQNTEKNPGDFKRLAITQALVKTIR